MGFPEENFTLQTPMVKKAPWGGQFVRFILYRRGEHHAGFP